MKKISGKELERRAQIARRGFEAWFEQLEREPDAIPDKTVIFTWSEAELAEVFTKERLRVFRKVKGRTYCTPKLRLTGIGVSI